MTDPLTNFEERHQQQSMGALAGNTYVGAKAECESRVDAFWATVAMLVAMFRQGDVEEGDQ